MVTCCLVLYNFVPLYLGLLPEERWRDRPVKGGRERETERDRDRDRERQRQRQTERWRERPTDRQTDI